MKRCRPRYNDGPDWYGGGKHVWFCEEHCDAIVWWLGNLGGGGRCGWFSRAAKDGKVKNSAQAEGRGGQHTAALGSAGWRLRWCCSCRCLWTVTVRQATVMLWGFSSTRLTPFVTSMNWTKNTRALSILPQGWRLKQPQIIVNYFFIELSQEWGQANSGAVSQQWSKGGDSKIILKCLFIECVIVLHILHTWWIAHKDMKAFFSCIAGEHHQSVGRDTSPPGSWECQGIGGREDNRVGPVSCWKVNRWVSEYER